MSIELVDVAHREVHLRGALELPHDEAKRIALFIHGGPDGTKEGPESLFVNLAAELAEHGIASARFDFRGEGETGGDYLTTTPSEQVEQYRAIVAYLRSRGFTRFGVVGESFGATAALSGYDENEVAALVLLWPAIWLLDGTFAPLINQSPPSIGPAFIEELHAHPDREIDLKRVTAPTLLIHGDADTEVPVRQSERAFEVLHHPKQLTVVPGADHCLRKPGEQALVIREVTAWLRLYLR